MRDVQAEPLSPFAAPTTLRRTCTVDIAIPVFNEERALAGCVHTLHAFLQSEFPFPWRITVVDNGSVDATWAVATDLAHRLDRVHVRRIVTRGKGAAIRTAWQESPAEIVVYMDVDLSTGLGALLPLVAPLVSGHSEVAIGSRTAPGSRIRRSAKREIISRGYNSLLRVGFGTDLTDTTCGFKAARAEAIRPLLLKSSDDGWFFDTELLLLAAYNGLRVHEVPVDWVEDADSRVEIVSTALHNLRALMRTSRAIATRAAAAPYPPRRALVPAHPDAIVSGTNRDRMAKLLPFAVIGLFSTAMHAVLYAGMRSFWVPAVANLAAMAVCAVSNTEAHRRWTFQGSSRRIRIHSRAAVLFAFTYAVTTAAATWASAHGDRAGETAALVVAAALTTSVRFVALDRWVFCRPTPMHRRRSRRRRSGRHGSAGPQIW
jgi:glycosyltransferase involved in cell wall biosynthesis